MAKFTYTAIDQTGQAREGTIEAVTMDVAIAALQRRDLIISSIEPAGGGNLFEAKFTLPFLNTVKTRDVVMLSRQITTLFEAQVSSLRAFRLLAAESTSPQLQTKLTAVADDIQGGSSISTALAHQPDVFSPFYVNMVRAGEEAGKLDQTFAFLADYLDRNYEITQKARNALIYPAFVIATFFVVMGLMMTMVIPRLAGILTETGQAIPIYTRVVLGISSFLSSYIVPILILIVIGAFLLFRYSRTETGSAAVARLQLGVPYIGDIFRKIYLSRIADNLSTMLKSGIQMVRGIEITASVVGNRTYEDILTKITDEVKSGLPVSDAMRKYEEFPGIVVAMVKIGEETGNVGEILDTMARFYRREVNNAIDTLVGLIEPFMIVTLAVGVAFLLASVLIPIYNISSGF